jgi:hypothetical protein
MISTVARFTSLSKSTKRLSSLQHVRIWTKPSDAQRPQKEGLGYLAAKSDTMSSGDSSKKEAKAQTEGETFKGSISGAVSTRKALRGRRISVLIAPSVLSCTDIQDMSSNL